MHIIDLRILMTLGDGKPHPYWEVVLFVHRLTKKTKKEIDKRLKKLAEYIWIKRLFRKSNLEIDDLILTLKGDKCFREEMIRRSPAMFRHYKYFDRTPESYQKLHSVTNGDVKAFFKSKPRTQIIKEIRSLLGKIPLSALDKNYMKRFMKKEDWEDKI